MKLPGSTKIKITNDENSKGVPDLDVVEVALVPRNIVNNYYQHGFKSLVFVSNKLFGQLLDTFHKNFICLKTFY